MCMQAIADPRRFLIMREMYERVRDNDAASVHMEVANDQNARGFTSSATASQMAWISIATANVLPEVHSLWRQYCWLLYVPVS